MPTLSTLPVNVSVPARASGGQVSAALHAPWRRQATENGLVTGQQASDRAGFCLEDQESGPRRRRRPATVSAMPDIAPWPSAPPALPQQVE